MGLLVDIVDELKEPGHPLTGGGGDEHDGGIGHVGEIPADVLPHAVHGLAVLFHQVPLVHHDDAGLAGVMGEPGHLGVLLGDALLGVDHNEAHIAALNGHGGPEHGVFLNDILHLGLLAHAGGVDEVILALVVFKIAVDGVPGGARHIADDHPLFAQDAVGKHGLAHIWLADDGHLDDIGVLLLLIGRGEVGDAGIQQVTGAVAVDGGDGDGVAQTQVVELIKIRVHGAGGVHLVHRQDNGLAAFLQHARHLVIRGGETGFDVGDKYDHRGVVDGDLGLLPHEGQDLAVGVGLDAAGVHQGEPPAAPLAFTVDAVPGDAGGVLHDGEALADELVKEHGLAHIGPSHNGDHGFRHGVPPRVWYPVSRRRPGPLPARAP